MSEGTMVCDVIKEKYPMACYHISDTLPTINWLWASLLSCSLGWVRNDGGGKCLNHKHRK
jgi:hypothetical protein